MKFLRAGVATIVETAEPGQILLEAEGRGAVAIPATILHQLLEAGAIVREGALLRAARQATADAGVRMTASGRDIEAAVIDDPSGDATDVLVNHAESPLAALMRRKTRAGEPFLSLGEFRAGERLRSDYSRGALMPRLGMNWGSPVASGRRGSGSGLTDLTDAALAARRRVDEALAAVGPELSGVLVDICCFLKGLEQVESERGWPVRSAKVVLKSALGALARHYEPHRGRKANSILRWGATGYRPDTL